MTAKVAPGLRAGRGLKQAMPMTFSQVGSSSRPSGWERIETYLPLTALPVLLVAPGLRAGRGLKPAQDVHECPVIYVAPGLRAGRGLKRHTGVFRPGNNE